MKKAILYGISLSLALSLTACGAPKEEAPEDTNTPAVTEPADTSTPESEKETNFEEPPVPVIYDIANDSNKDGAISKEEWEDWVAKHPEDKNQNMDLTDDVVIETPTPEPTPNPGTSSGNNNSGGTTSGGGTTTTPSTPDADTGNDVTPGNTNISDKDMEAIKNMIEDAGGTWDPATDEELQEAADELGGTYDPETGGIIGGDNWVM